MDNYMDIDIAELQRRATIRNNVDWFRPKGAFLKVPKKIPSYLRGYSSNPYNRNGKLNKNSQLAKHLQNELKNVDKL